MTTNDYIKVLRDEIQDLYNGEQTCVALDDMIETFEHCLDLLKKEAEGLI